MKISVVGTGASGWMAVNYLMLNPQITEIVVIGSSKIPTIGVGESTTGRFDDYLEIIGVDAAEFVTESDAAVKYGVQYEGWGPRTFLHGFKSIFSFQRQGWDQNHWGRLLGSKPQGQCIHELIQDQVWEFTRHNHVSQQAYGLLEQGTVPPEIFAQMPREFVNAWHFDANCFIRYMTKRALRDPRVKLIDARVVDCLREDDEIRALVLEDQTKITADYYVISTGETRFNETVFGARYHSLGDVLLTDRALFMPIEYQDLDREFHPYTVARSMPHGWRWITPTYSRIGSGYAFSTHHISEDQAVTEFLADVGDPTRTPFVVDFKPRTIDRAYYKNYSFLGMAAGFVEPLDAPGLDHAVNNIMQIGEYLSWDADTQRKMIPEINKIAKQRAEWYCSFILCQYKHSSRSDTEFWRDQKSVTYEPYEQIMANIDDINRVVKRNHHMMFYHTIAARDVQWTVSPELAQVPLMPVPELELPTLHHRYFIEDLRQRYRETQQ